MTEPVTSIDPIAKALKDAMEEFEKEASAAAKHKIKASLVKIGHAKKVLANLELEHEALLRDLRAEAVA